MSLQDRMSKLQGIVNDSFHLLEKEHREKEASSAVPRIDWKSFNSNKFEMPCRGGGPAAYTRLEISLMRAASGVCGFLRDWAAEQIFL